MNSGGRPGAGVPHGLQVVEAARTSLKTSSCIPSLDYIVWGESCGKLASVLKHRQSKTAVFQTSSGSTAHLTKNSPRKPISRSEVTAEQM